MKFIINIKQTTYAQVEVEANSKEEVQEIVENDDLYDEISYAIAESCDFDTETEILTEEENNLPKEVSYDELTILDGESPFDIICERLESDYNYLVKNFSFETELLPFSEESNGPTYTVEITNIEWDIE